MPAEIVNVDEFVRLSELASACKVKRLKDVVKLKLRTSSRLYTMKLEPDTAQEVLKQLKCEIQEV